MRLSWNKEAAKGNERRQGLMERTACRSAFICKCKSKEEVATKQTEKKKTKRTSRKNNFSMQAQKMKYIYQQTR